MLEWMVQPLKGLAGLGSLAEIAETRLALALQR